MNSSPPTPKPLKRNPLSPHSADALAQCSFFLSTPSQASAATRGLSVHDYLVQRFLPDTKTPDVPPELHQVFDWGVRTTLEFAKGYTPLVDRSECRVVVPGINRLGYCDCLVPKVLTSIEWKSGSRRSYRRQQGMYALGKMTELFAVSWTCVVLFLDEQETEFHRFTFEEAEEIVAQARLAYDIPEPPRINESCNYCGNFFECPRQLELAAHALQVADGALDWPAIVNDPKRLGKFLLGCSSLKDFEKEGRLKGREFFFQKVEVPGFRLSNGKRSWSLPVETLFSS